MDKIIHEYNPGGRSVKWFIRDEKYLVSMYFSTGSSISVEDLNSPGWKASGWYYMNETDEECVTRLISELNNGSNHAHWRENGINSWGSVGTIKYTDKLTPEKIREIETGPNFSCWGKISILRWGEFIEKEVYDYKTFSYRPLTDEQKLESKKHNEMMRHYESIRKEN